ncbi:MAG: tryptophan--tRNA ligase [Clostridiales bacterium]|nr:tryptophan--tRNA ligase [Candidatus Coliplasma caballi]
MENNDAKKMILSGIQPSGTLTLGNYLGALRNWVKVQDDYNCYYMLADLHTITVRQVPAELRQNCLKTAAIYLAAGIDPIKSTLFLQSMVPAHSQLAWVLNCYTMTGELTRMTQFKDKSARHADNVNAGLYTYPVLMAADILLYQADYVPVGKDQLQHLEITRDIATRFNNAYSETFKIPQGMTTATGAHICSLSDPTKKMSKSEEGDGTIFILDPKDVIIRKIKRAVTDSGSEVRYAEGKDGINNLMNIYSAITGKTNVEIEKEFEGKGYGDFKLAVAEVVADVLGKLQEEYNRYIADKEYINGILKDGAEKANYIARKTLSKVYRKVGFYDPTK